MKTTAVVQALMKGEGKDEPETFGWTYVVGRWEESPSLGSFLLWDLVPSIETGRTGVWKFQQGKDGEFLGLS